MNGVSFLRHLLELTTTRPAGDKFSFLVEEISSLSGVVACHGAQLSVLADELMVTRAAHAEEVDGRINFENLNHLIIIGGPFLDGDDLQNRLKQQVMVSFKLAL